jgi:hypothetical protein
VTTTTAVVATPMATSIVTGSFDSDSLCACKMLLVTLVKPGAAGSLTSTGTSLLDYKRGVPVARPCGGLDGRRIQKNRECKNIYECDNTCECNTLIFSPQPPFFPRAKELLGAGLPTPGTAGRSAQRGHVPLGL